MIGVVLLALQVDWDGGSTAGGPVGGRSATPATGGSSCRGRHPLDRQPPPQDGGPLLCKPVRVGRPVEIVALSGIGNQVEDFVATVAEVVHVLEVTHEPGQAA